MQLQRRHPRHLPLPGNRISHQNVQNPNKVASSVAYLSSHFQHSRCCSSHDPLPCDSCWLVVSILITLIVFTTQGLIFKKLNLFTDTHRKLSDCIPSINTIPSLTHSAKWQESTIPRRGLSRLENQTIRLRDPLISQSLASLHPSVQSTLHHLFLSTSRSQTRPAQSTIDRHKRVNRQSWASSVQHPKDIDQQQLQMLHHTHLENEAVNSIRSSPFGPLHITIHRPRVRSTRAQLRSDGRRISHSIRLELLRHSILLNLWRRRCQTRQRI